MNFPWDPNGKNKNQENDILVHKLRIDQSFGSLDNYFQLFIKDILCIALSKNVTNLYFDSAKMSLFFPDKFYDLKSYLKFFVDVKITRDLKFNIVVVNFEKSISRQ
ncbi:hypothetical protein BpHYR1_010977 [Brachionus plicatilis]|uniref:Uncharacterized protein n=1 Tax=Brachionus plicatilis TaxID=10195 RepID=A0A3M7T1A6_BRAPC|nr:hypothetical protein BpHYR1_010977 [Brachionus plicatilis]